MGEYKPLGSEKLNQDAKLKRILELAYYDRKNSNKNIKDTVVKESYEGGVYGIVKEKDAYYVKRGINESSLDYIGGMFMKNKNRFSSYAEALKRMESLKTNDLQEATRYVLKSKSNDEAKTPDMNMSMPPAPAGDMPPPPAGDMPPPPAGDMAPPENDMAPPENDMAPPPEGDMDAQAKKSDYMSEVQKYAGKLGQELRDQIEKMESDDIKYVLNMVISAVDLDKLDIEDLEEIGKKFERDEDDDEIPEEEPSIEEPIPTEEPEAEPAADSDLGEDADPILKLEKFVNNNSYETTEDIDFAKYAIKETGEIDEDTVELDMDEIKSEIANSVNATLSKYFK